MGRATYSLPHVVTNITFGPRQEVGPCTCKCGWQGLSSDFAVHLKGGVARKHRKWVKDAGTPEWNRTLNRQAALDREAGR